MSEGNVMALVPLSFCVSESFCTSISWHLQALGKKVTGEHTAVLVPTFSADQQDSSATIQNFR